MTMHEPVFRIKYRVIYGDTDAGSVVYNANYLRFFEIGRTEMMRCWAMPYQEIEQQGLILPVTETYLRYKAPARYDDLLTIGVSLAELKKVSCRFHYRVTRNDDGKERFLVKGLTNHACVNRQGRLTPFPAEIHERISGIWNRQKEEKSSDHH